MEEWRNIDGYTHYQISNLGNIKSINGKLVKKQSDKYGYLVVGLYKNGNGKFIKEESHQIERELGFSHESISSCCIGSKRDYHNGKTYPVHSAYGYKWRCKYDS